MPLLRFLLPLVLLLWGGAAWAVQSPPPVEPGRTCWAPLPAGLPASEALARADWQCQTRISALAKQRIAARFAPLDEAGRPIRYLRAGLGPLGTLTLLAQGRDGTLVAHTVRADEARVIVGQPSFAAAFPRVAEPVALYAILDRVGSAYTVRTMEAVATPSDAIAGSTVPLLLLAMMVGMLSVLAVIDLAIFRVMRQGFFLFHAFLTMCVAALVTIWSGLLLEFVRLDMEGWYRSLMMVLGATAVAACLFNRRVAQEAENCTWEPRALSWAAGFSAVATALFTARMLDPILPLGTFAYVLVPVLALVCVTLVQRFRHGDPSARIQVLGWAPLLLFFAVQFVADMLGLRLPGGGLQLLYCGVFVESLVSVVGLGRRFLTLSRERDRAQARAHVMGDLAERDHLTGLLNRRAIDNRFADLRKRGYDTLALIDLDHFKMINDVSGHAVGDQVLEVTARVLASDPDNIAVRLGGEEFLLLMRGTDASERAEKLRRMLSVRVAREVDGLEQIVTASMGLLSLPADALETLSFSHAYSRADLLLYEAKRDGRNRTKAAHWRFFNHRAEELARAEEIADRPIAPAAA